MTKLTWEELDNLATADEIAEALRKAGVKGHRDVCYTCPLAKATGWWVHLTRRARAAYDSSYESLTEAEKDFIQRFDAGYEYCDLEEPV